MALSDVPTKEVDLEGTAPDASDDPTRRVTGLRADQGTRRVMLDRPRDAGQLVPLGFLPAGTALLDKYEVLETIHPHETERAGVFVCRADKQKVVVKVAALNHPPKAEMWERLKELKSPHIITVLDTLERGGLFYEVQEFCPGGSLSKRLAKERFSPDWIMSVLVPQLNEALKYLHAQGIVHRDVKPANIYMRSDNNVVLGDFDISSVLRTDRTSRDTKRGAGTWEYMPPEAFPRFVDPAGNQRAARVTRTADYYSLGISIIELVLGTTSLHSSDLPDLYDFYLAGGQIELPSGPQPLVRLLRGLLIRERHKRWSAEQVDRWLAQKNTYDDVQSILDDEYFSLKRAVQPYTIQNMHATDLPSLAETLSTYPDEALDDLLKSNRLTDWVSGLDMNLARTLERDRDIWRQEPDNCLFRCVMFCDRTRPFPILGIGKAKTKREFLQKIAESDKPDDQIAAGPMGFQEVRKLDSWLHLKPDAEPELANRVGATLWQPSHIRFEEVAYIFDPTLPYSHERSALETLRLPEDERRGGSTPREIVALALGKESDWAKGIPACYLQAYDRWKAGYLEAWMRQRGLGPLAQKARDAANALEDHPYAAFETFLRILEPSTPPLLIRFDKDDLAKVCETDYGEQATSKVRYTAEGVGIPFGSIHVSFAPEGVSLEPNLIDSREGAIALTIDPNLGVPVSRAPRVLTIDIQHGNCKLAGDRPVLRYWVKPSKQMAWKAILTGVVFGFFGLSGPRFIISLAGGNGPLTFPSVSNVFDNAANWQLPETQYILALIVTLGYLYGAFRLWLWALRRSEL